MLHHIPEPEGLVREMLRVAKPEGAVVIRDLKRLSKFMTALHVNLFGLTYNDLMKKEYRDSIMASLTEEEMRELADRVGLGRETFSRAFVTHMTLARPAANRRPDRVTVPVAAHKRLAKRFYVCTG
jgi:ubiquinone/menaquinone biosynthesis C-methylase UbiE